MAMHRAFHLERHNVATNLCPCTSCTQANNLKLKFVAHIGEVATQTIRQRSKLVGIDVILVHRMLKNPVDVPEYLLLSEELYNASSTPLPGPAHEVSQDLEGIGPVRAYFMDVADLPGSARPCRIHPCSDASATPWPLPAPACRACWACAAGPAPPPLSEVAGWLPDRLPQIVAVGDSRVTLSQLLREPMSLRR